MPTGKGITKMTIQDPTSAEEVSRWATNKAVDIIAEMSTSPEFRCTSRAQLIASMDIAELVRKAYALGVAYGRTEAIS